jgi:hypothetical protein
MRRSWWALIALLPSALLADTVYLKGGGKVQGRIVTRTETAVEVDVGAGNMKVSMANVDRIVEGASPLTEYASRAAALGPQDVEGWRNLARWASSQGLNTQSKQAWEKVRALAPGDAEANQALGQVQVGSRWVSEEESYRSRGYVKFEGEWMTPAEQQRIQQERSAARSARPESPPPREAPKPKADEETQEGIPLYWGWGVGPSAWPGTNFPAGVAPPVRPRN